MKEISIEKEKFYELINSIKFFKVFNKEEIDHMSSIFNILEYSENESIIREGEKSPYLFIILEGAVIINVCQKDDDNCEKEVYLSTIGKGDVIGEAAVFSNVKRTANVVSSENVKVIRIMRENLITYIKKNHIPGMKILMFIIYSLLNKIKDMNKELAFERKASIEQDDIDSLIDNFIN